MPKMIVIAGPPGGGKSTVFSSAYFAEIRLPYFNIDERCKALHGSSHAIPAAIRVRANEDLRAFCEENLARQAGFAFETTLRADFAIRAAEHAKRAGFTTEMHYLAAPVEIHVQRVTARALAGGHSASEPRLRQMYADSMHNLVRALKTFDHSQLHDTTDVPEPQAAVVNGLVSVSVSQPAPWILQVLAKLT